MTTTRNRWNLTTWNPVTGCTKFSEGCLNCYARGIALRLQALGQKNYENGFTVSPHPQLLTRPLQWKKPRFIFINSMSDLFHKDVPLEYLQQIFQVLSQAHWHTFFSLTKRANRLKELASKLHFPPNLWMGVTVESARHISRIQALQEVPAKVRFVNFEPLLSPIPQVNLQGIHWVTVGGETGPNARPLKKAWVEGILDQCRRFNIPFNFKQWGDAARSYGPPLLRGKYWNQMPNRTKTGFSFTPSGQLELPFGNRSGLAP